MSSNICAAFMMEGFMDVGYKKIALANEVMGQGMLETVTEMVEHAELADKLYHEGEDPPGVFDYEVSAEFGNWFGQYVIEENQTPSKEEAEKMLRQISETFFNQGSEPAHPQAQLLLEPKETRWAVLTWTLCGGWVNGWTIEEDGVCKPHTFATEAEAQKELDEFIQDSKDAVARGDLEDAYSADEYRIEQVTG